MKSKHVYGCVALDIKQIDFFKLNIYEEKNRSVYEIFF